MSTSGRCERGLVIGGFDPSGGAGVTIDLLTFNEIGVFAYASVSAVTVQNSLAVRGIYPVAAPVLKGQIEAAVEEGSPSVIKIGLLATAENVLCVADIVRQGGFKAVVLDPVIKATTGADLLEAAGVKLLRERLVPLATVVTPNLYEAERMSGRLVRDVSDMKEAAAAIQRLGADWVLVKGGHLAQDKAVDILYNGKRLEEFSQTKVDKEEVRGTGCRLASALAAHLARGRSVPEATLLAREHTLRAIREAE